MNIQTDYNNRISFNARLGANLKSKLLKEEFGGDVNRLKNFEMQFQDAVKEALDTNTILERNNNGHFQISNLIAPDITYPIKLFYRDKLLSQRILDQGWLKYLTTECRLFEKIVSKKFNSGKSMDELRELAADLNEIRRPYYTDVIDSAKRILKDNPNSKLTDLEFSEMNTIQLREIVESPEFQKLMSEKP